MKQNNLVLILISLIVGTIMTSGLININFQHNLHLPKELTNKNGIYVSKHFKGDIYDVYLASLIKDGNYDYREVYRTLDNATSRDQVVLHVSGNGGSVDTVAELVNHIDSSKAQILIKVTGSVYSGHAIIGSLSGKNITRELAYNTILYYHTESGFGTDCNKIEHAQDLDRAMTNAQVCELVISAANELTNRLIDRVVYLTPLEKYFVKNGITIIKLPTQTAEVDKSGSVLYIDKVPEDFESNSEQSWVVLEGLLVGTTAKTIYIDWKGIGGSTYMMNNFIDKLKVAENQGKKIIFNIVGWTASCHAIAVCAASTYKFQDSGTMMFHQPFTRIFGTKSYSPFKYYFNECVQKNIISKQEVKTISVDHKAVYINSHNKHFIIDDEK